MMMQGGGAQVGSNLEQLYLLVLDMFSIKEPHFTAFMWLQKQLTLFPIAPIQARA